MALVFSEAAKAHKSVAKKKELEKDLVARLKKLPADQQFVVKHGVRMTLVATEVKEKPPAINRKKLEQALEEYKGPPVPEGFLEKLEEVSKPKPKKQKASATPPKGKGTKRRRSDEEDEEAPAAKGKGPKRQRTDAEDDEGGDETMDEEEEEPRPKRKGKPEIKYRIKYTIEH